MLVSKVDNWHECPGYSSTLIGCILFLPLKYLSMTFFNVTVHQNLWPLKFQNKNSSITKIVCVVPLSVIEKVKTRNCATAMFCLFFWRKVRKSPRLIHANLQNTYRFWFYSSTVCKRCFFEKSCLMCFIRPI